MVRDHSDSEKGNPLPPHRLVLSINSKGSFICTIPQTGYTYHGLCYTSRGALAGTRNSSMGKRYSHFQMILTFFFDIPLTKEGNVLFNDVLNTFYLWCYRARNMEKDHSDVEIGNPLSPHGLLFPISSKGSFYMQYHTDRITHTSAFVTSVVEHWLEREIAQVVHHEGSIIRPIAQ